MMILTWFYRDLIGIEWNFIWIHGPYGKWLGDLPSGHRHLQKDHVQWYVRFFSIGSLVFTSEKKKSFEMKSTDLNPCVVASTSRIANLEVHIQGRTRFDFPDLECEIPECSQASSRMGIWHNLLHHQDSETLDSINKISKKSNDLCWGLVEIPSIPVPVNPQTLQWKIPPFTDDVHWLPH